MNTIIKKVANNIYHVNLIDVCGLCGQQLLDFIKNNKISIHSSLILESGSKNCNMTCDEDFLKASSYFDDIAYVVNEETATYNPWKHAMLIRNSNKNTHYFDSYKDAFNWLTLHRKENEIKSPLDFTGDIRKSNW